MSTLVDADDDVIVIAVMGVTGAGKTSLIKLITERDDINVGESLFSDTSEIRGYEFFHSGKTYIMIDTPGFDDTRRSDRETTESLLTWLRDSLLSGQRLNGVIYLHRITDLRMSGSALRNQRMFCKLVGEEALSNVVLAMNFWEQVPERQAIERENELRRKRDFWGGMLERGARMVRLRNDRDQALALLEEMSRNGKIVLDAQEEMVNQGLSVMQTSVARGIGQQQEMDRQAQIVALREEMIEMQRLLDEERASLELVTAIVLSEAEEEYQIQRREFEAEQESQELQRQRECEMLERLRVEHERQAEQLRQDFQRRYICIGYQPTQCSRCLGETSQFSHYYHCCFCYGDQYFHCENCGNDCGNPTHPVMESLE